MSFEANPKSDKPTDDVRASVKARMAVPEAPERAQARGAARAAYAANGARMRVERVHAQHVVTAQKIAV